MPGATVNMLVLGDSIMWGQGLREQEKIHALVAAAIPTHDPTVTKVARFVLAHSGAAIGVRLSDHPPRLAVQPVGEVPWTYPTIIQQYQGFAGVLPGDVDLILVDGGINDVGAQNILDPNLSSQALDPAIDQSCYTDMKTLLAGPKTGLRAKFPNARIVVTGYYPILSTMSDLSSLELLCVAMAGPLWGLGGAILAESAKQQIAINCMHFADRSAGQLNQAVFEAAAGSDQLIGFVDPQQHGFNMQHSAFTADPWLFGIGPTGQPQDPIDRHAACAAAFPDRPLDELQCERASAGHPNPQGAAVYAGAIIQVLYPPPALVVSVSPSPVSMGVPTSVVVTARDYRTHAPVAGQVTIHNFNAQHRPVAAEVFNTGVAHTTTFYEGLVRTFDPQTRTWTMEPASPTGVVNATGYPSAEVPFGW